MPDDVRSLVPADLGALLDDAAPVQAPPPREGDGDPDECPVVPLGHDDGRYWFLSPSGELRCLNTREFTPVGLLALFCGQPEWMIRHFPKFDKDGNQLADFTAREVAGFLIRASEAVGLFDPALKLRGRGVWRGTDDREGRPTAVCHAGDRVARVDGGGCQWRRAGWRDGWAVYPARPKVEAPAFDAPAKEADGRLLLDHLGLWRFRDAEGARLLAGVHTSGLLGGYPKFRPHALVDAEFGSGKTWLCTLLAEAAGAQADMMNSYSEPGLRQVLQDEARIAVLDEAETDGGNNGMMQQVLGLLRRMSTGKGADIVRGTPGGQVKRYSVMGCAIMAGINPPPLMPQDRSRILHVPLLKATDDPEAAAKVEAATAWAKVNSARLRARVILAAQQFGLRFELFRGALMAERCDGRLADLFASALAGADVLLKDKPPDSDSLGEIIAPLVPRLRAMRAADQEDNDAGQCWNHLMSYVPDHWRSGTRLTVGALIAAARTETDGKGENGKALTTYGLRVMVPKDGPPVLWIANRHGGLRRIFAGTRWADGGWTGALSKLGDGDDDDLRVTPHERPERFSGALSRCLSVPAGHLPETDEA